MAIIYQNLEDFPDADAACILVHGLNNKPTVVNDIADFLKDLALPVVIVSLTGHYHDFEKIKSVTKETWDQDVLEAYNLAGNRFGKIYLIAYSIGAAIGLDILSERVRFDKMVLLAPAIVPRLPIKWLQFIAPVFPSMPLWSIAPASYQANPFLPLNAYDVLLKICKSVEQKSYVYANTPTLVFIDPKDETMNLSKLKQTKAKYRLSQWEILTLNSNHVTAKVKFHHLIVDKEAMGPDNWQMFTTKIARFLLH